MDRLALMRTFVAAMESGSFTAAALRLRSDPKLVSKHVGTLEDLVGTRLLHRTTRSLSPTEAGRRYYEGAVDLLARAEALESSLSTEMRSVAGRIRVSAPVTYGELVLLPQLARLAAAHPLLSVDLRLSDRFVDLAEEGFDLALRIGGPPNSSLFARRLGSVETWLVAAPAQITEIGDPRRPEDISGAVTIGDSNLRRGQFWHLARGDEVARISILPWMTVNSPRAAAELAAAGRGIALCPDFVAEPHIAAGRLARVLDDWIGPTLDVRAVFLEPRRQPARVRILIDHLARQSRNETPE